MKSLSHPKDCSLPGSSVHGIFQARVLEWIAIAFSGQLRLDHNKLISVSSCFLWLHSKASAEETKCYLSHYSGLAEVLFLFGRNDHWPNAINMNTLQLIQELFQVLRKRHFNRKIRDFPGIPVVKTVFPMR